MAGEHICVCCPQLRRGDPRIYDRPQCCESCRLRLRGILADIVTGYRQLAGELVPSQGHGERVTGSKEAPLPLRVNPLDLTMPATTRPVRDTFGDQVGYVSVAALLDSWARDWQSTLFPDQSLPRPSVRHLTAWLLNRLDDACDRHAAVDDFAAEMRDLLSATRRVTGTTDIKPELMKGVPCRECDHVSLFRTAGSDYIECGNCGCLMTPDEYQRWTALISAPEHQQWVRDVIATQRQEEVSA